MRDARGRSEREEPVRSIGRVLGWTTAAAATALALGACGGGSGGSSTAALDDGLRRDLQLAAASSVELAGGARDRQAARFVSAVEGAPQGEGNDVTRADRRGTARHRAPTRGVRRVAQARPAPAADVSPAETPAMVEAPAAVVASNDEAPAPAPADTPAPSPEPERPVAVGGPSAGEDRGEIDEGRRGRRGNGGGWIGVVIRGGGVGDIDHCERDMPGRRGGGVLVNRRFPGLPSGGWGGPLGGRVGAVINQVATRR
jgi:hypothetical protein